MKEVDNPRGIEVLGEDRHILSFLTSDRIDTRISVDTAWYHGRDRYDDIEDRFQPRDRHNYKIVVTGYFDVQINFKM